MKNIASKTNGVFKNAPNVDVVWPKLFCINQVKESFSKCMFGEVEL